MLDILLSHWLTYVYLTWVLILLVLCLVYRPQVRPLYGQLRQLRARGLISPVLRIRRIR